MALKLIGEQNIKPIALDTAENAEEINEVEVSETAINIACQEVVNGLIQASWNYISEVNSVIASLDYELKEESNKAEILEILNQIVDDSTVNIGMLHKVFELLTQDKSDLITSGEQKASELIDTVE